VELSLLLGNFTTHLAFIFFPLGFCDSSTLLFHERLMLFDQKIRVSFFDRGKFFFLVSIISRHFLSGRSPNLRIHLIDFFPLVFKRVVQTLIFCLVDHQCGINNHILEIFSDPFQDRVLRVFHIWQKSQNFALFTQLIEVFRVDVLVISYPLSELPSFLHQIRVLQTTLLELIRVLR